MEISRIFDILLDLFGKMLYNIKVYIIQFVKKQKLVI